jgi:hypothetical protein
VAVSYRAVVVHQLGVIMQKRIVSSLAVCAISFFLFFATNASAQFCCYTYVSNMLPQNEVPAPLDTPMSGLGVVVVTFNDDGTSSALVIANAFGNETPITASHIHIGDAGVAGPIICPMTGADFTNPVITTCNFTVDQTTALLSPQGSLYMQVHTQAHPGGEIRDQLNFVQ